MILRFSFFWGGGRVVGFRVHGHGTMTGCKWIYHRRSGIEKCHHKKVGCRVVARERL